MAWRGMWSSLTAIPGPSSRDDDDFYDRLSHRWTVGLLLAFALLVTTATYIRDNPISCWAPKEFTDSWQAYTNSYCWISNTYYMEFEEEIPRSPFHRRNHNPIVYYQWTPMILVLQAFLFYIPIAIWRSLNDRTGIDVVDIIETAEKYQHCEDQELKAKYMKYLVRQLDRSLSLKKQAAKTKKEDGCCRCNRCCSWFTTHCLFCLCSGRSGSYLQTLYLLLKLVYLGNAIGQLFMLNWLLGQEYSVYGYDVIKAWLEDRDWSGSSRFPRVALCDVDVRRVANLHRYTVQCVLPLNLFNERIYLFLWFWTLLVGLLTLVGLFIWLARLCIPANRRHYVTERLPITRQHQQKRAPVMSFINDYLRTDGYLVLRLVDANCNRMTIQDMLAGLWEIHMNQAKLSKISEDTNNVSLLDSISEVFEEV